MIEVEELLDLVNRDIPGWEDPIIAELHEIRRQLRAEREADPEGYQRRLQELHEEHLAARNDNETF